jgi:hypothetical protein
MVNMQKYYEKSLKVIQQQGIKNEKDYNKVAKTYVILSSESLKYISCTRKFEKIVKLSEKVN